MVEKFNMALFHLMRLNERLSDGDKAALAGDYKGWYVSLELAYSMCRMECTAEEKATLDGQIRAVRQSIKNAYGNKRHQNFTLGKAHDLLIMFSNNLHETLDRHDLIQPKINVNSSMIEAIKKHYGVQDE